MTRARLRSVNGIEYRTAMLTLAAFSARRTRRHVAVAAACVWLFAQVAGAAHAATHVGDHAGEICEVCLLSGADSTAAPAAAADAPALTPRHVAPPSAAAPSIHRPRTHGARAPPLPPHA